MHRAFAAALVAVLFLAATPLAASTFLHMSPRELVAGADALVRGEVIELESFWSESGRVIVTEATIAVEAAILGQVPSIVTVRTFGGQVGDVRVEAHGFPRFEPGERVLLFLERHEDDTLRVLGYQQGQFRVVTRLDGVTLAVPMVDEDARFLTRDGRVAPEPRSLEIGLFTDTVLRLAGPAGAPSLDR